MFRPYRRLWFLFAALMLATPLALSPASFGRGGASGTEQRPLAPPPSIPRTLSAMFAVPRQAEAYLNDHFGLRDTLIAADAFIRHRLLRSGNASVLLGQDDWLFYRGDEMLEQSAGILIRSGQVAATADFVDEMRTALAAQGVPLIVAPPPNSSTIYPEMLPPWARHRGGPTEYDLFAAQLAARGVVMRDLRPVMLAAKSNGPAYFRFDTHWTPRGALAAFNAITGQAGLPGWNLPPTQALGQPQPRTASDLRRMLDLSDGPPDVEEPLVAPPITAHQAIGAGAYVATAPNQGPTIMVIGDSFTEQTFLPLILHKAARLVWTHHQRCGFDWKLVEQFKPDQVWFMPTERYILCLPGARPAGMPAKLRSPASP